MPDGSAFQIFDDGSYVQLSAEGGVAVSGDMGMGQFGADKIYKVCVRKLPRTFSLSSLMPWSASNPADPPGSNGPTYEYFDWFRIPEQTVDYVIIIEGDNLQFFDIWNSRDPLLRSVCRGVRQYCDGDFVFGIGLDAALPSINAGRFFMINSAGSPTAGRITLPIINKSDIFPEFRMGLQNAVISLPTFVRGIFKKEPAKPYSNTRINATARWMLNTDTGLIDPMRFTGAYSAAQLADICRTGSLSTGPATPSPSMQRFAVNRLALGGR